MAAGLHQPLRPTNVRYVVLLLTTLVAVLLYLDRICLGFAERYIKDDLSLSREEMQLIFSSFFWAYAVGQLPAGWLSDRFGARLMLTIFLAGWSAFTGLLAFAYGMIWLVLFRFGCGLFEAGAYPAAAGLIRRWMPFERRGFASGIVSVGGRVGGAFAPILTAYLLVAFVPLSVPSRLEPADLVNAPALVTRLSLPENESARVLAEKIKALLSQHALDRLREIQTLDGVVQPLLVSTFASTVPFRSGQTLSLRTDLVAALNANLAEPDMLAGLRPADFDLPEESFPTSAAGRSTEQIERDNRLLLEAAYPDAIRKIFRTGWRPVMLIYGGAGIIVAIIFWLFMRDRPSEHPACNVAEQTLIEGHDPLPAHAHKSSIEWRRLLFSPSLWWISLVQICTNFAWVFLITWLPKYLYEVHRVPIVERGWMTSLPIFVGIAGMFSGGWLTDAAVKRLGRRWGRSLPLGLSRFGVAIGFALCVFLHAPWPTTLMLCLVAFATDLGTPSIWAYSLDTGGKHVATVLAWSNMFGNIGAAVGAKYLDAIAQHHGWHSMFWTCSAVMLVAGVASFAVDATRPIVPEKVDADSRLPS